MILCYYFLNIYVNQNDLIDKNTLILDYETSKANFEICVSKRGYVQFNCVEGDIIQIGDVVAIVSENKEYVHEFKNQLTENNSSEQTFSKKAEKLISEMSIEKSMFKNESFVTEEIVNNFIDNSNNITNASEVIKLSPRKLFEITNLTNGPRNGLISKVEKTFNSSKIDTETLYEKNEFKGSVSLLLIKVVSELLKSEEYKHLNSYCDGKNIYIHQDVNFGLALNLGSGLKIGVIKKSDLLAINEIESYALRLIDNYIDDKLQKEDIEGFSVVLTDLTEKGIDNFTPLITTSNSIMIGLAGHKSSIQRLIISFDHRVTDGLEISNFVNDILTKFEKDFSVKSDK